MTTEGSSEHADSERDEENAEVEEPSAAEVEETEDEPEASREVAHDRPPRTTREVTGAPLMNFARIDAGDMLGIGKVVSDIQRSMVPDMQQNWQKELLPVIATIQRNLAPELADLHRTVLPSMQAMIDTLVPAIVTVNSAVQLSGITGFLETFQVRHREMMKNLTPTFDAATVLGPLVTQMSGFAEFRRDIQHMGLTPTVDESTLREMTTSLRVVVEAASRLKTTDHDLDEEEFEEVASQALREVDEDYDPDLPPTSQQMAATEALVQLLVALRPDLSDDPIFRRRVAWVSGSGGALAGLALLMFYPPVFAAVGTLFVFVSIVQGTQKGADRLIAPSAHKKTQDTED